MRYELKIALRYLRARRKQAFISVTTVFTAVGVMIGVAALTITLAVMGGFEQSLKNRVLSLSPQVQILSTEGSITNYQALQKRVDSVRGVAGSDPFIVGQGMLSSGRGIGGVIVRGIEPANRVVDEEWSKYVVAGNLLDLAKVLPARDPASHQKAGASGIAIGSDLADKLKVKLGDPVRMVAPIITTTQSGDLSTRIGDYRVAAIFESGMTFMDSQMTFVDLAQAQQFFGRPGRVDGIDVHLVNLGETASVTLSLRKLLKEPYVVRNWIEYNQSAAAGFEILKRVYSLVLVLLIGVAAFNLVATLIMVVMEKRKDIAVLLAMGATRRDVWRIFVLKGLVVGGAGTAAGLLMGATGCFALAHYHFIHIPKQIYGISTVPIAADPVSFLLVALASLTLCLVATFYPAARAARAIPVEVFRS